MNQLHDLLEKISFPRQNGATIIRNILLPMAHAAGAIALAYITWLVLKRILAGLEKRAHKIRFIQINIQIFSIARTAIAYAIFLMIGTYLIRLFGIYIIEKPFQALIIIVYTAPLKKVLVLLLQYLKDNLAHRTETKVDDIIFDLLNRLAGVIIYSIAIIMALDILGINIMPFIAGAGVIGVAIGFAAKDTLSNLIAGILLIIDRPFEIGDRIEVWSAPAGSASWGDVIDIGVRATKIKTTDNITIVIPNNEIMRRDIVNYTLTSQCVRVRVNIGVAYDTDIDKAKQAIINVAEKIEWIMRDPPPKVVVRSFGESSVDLQLRVWIHDARRRMDTISFITDNVKSEFDRLGIEIPYPKRDITIINRGQTT
jgi:small-conductance mechanosensitive channel